ncbi:MULTISPECIES: IS3 family transposase [unclassified Lysinibacillus]|uniref:IS3 family transposase n=1 Tax=unclassified Lysinibacillus TaxID=2636778 RepID=UPI002552A995|nr:MULTISPECIES: IS3 family transposase [unclassified Lysinibacillus]MDM5247648.1 IS3 family transposase [Lysinibacillus sp. G4S2]MDM5248899.1 IS3 family transposase [Lysinibacillus sp. G4S2]MDM5249378.1 IS3 family transposase [Lysinibacillus sp. G4S2]
MTKRKSYDKEFKLEAVQLVESGKRVAEVARELDLAEQTLHNWVKKFSKDGEVAFVGSGNLKPEDKENKELEKRIRDLEEENAILKKANGHLCERPEVIYNFIQQHRHEFRVAKMCEVLGVSRSGYYEWLNRPKSNQKERKEKLTSQIKRVYLDSRRNYGSPKITKQLNSEGVSVSQKTVSRIMKEEGIRSKTVKKYKATTNSKHNLPVYPNLLDQQFKVERPGQAWVADITYIWTSEGWLYLATIMELFSRRIIGWAMDERMTKELVILALKRAIRTQTPTPGLIHHSDRGSQYASKEYQQVLRTNRMITSMSRKGNCYDNACIESFHSVIKRELVFHEKYKTRDQAKKSIIEYIVSFYNYKRIHSFTNYMSPIAYEKQYFKTSQKTKVI